MLYLGRSPPYTRGTLLLKFDILRSLELLCSQPNDAVSLQSLKCIISISKSTIALMFLKLIKKVND